MANKRAVLALDRNLRNLELLAQFLAKQGYKVESVSTLEEFDQTLAEPETIGVALVDISGFDRSIWQYCEKLHELKIPFLVLSPKQSSAIRQESFARGAQSMLVKPLVVKELLAILRTILRDPD